MITQAHLKVYQKYAGDSDGLGHEGTQEEKTLFKDGEWGTIDNLLQSIQIIQNNLGSFEFKENIEKKIKEYCDNDTTIVLLYKTYEVLGRKSSNK